MREARNITRKLASVETLGARNKGEQEESVSSWVEQMRAKDQERKLAEQRVRGYTTSMDIAIIFIFPLLG